MTSREPKGVPTGGRFAARTHAEAEGVVLTEPATGVTLPPGRYVLGDPCYSVPDDKWGDWLVDSSSDEAVRGVRYAEIDGHHVVGVYTKHGDGQYYSSEGHSLGVDAGMIGLVPEALAENNTSANLKVIEFTEPVLCRDDDGVIHLGHIEINTGDEDDDGDEDEDEDVCSCGRSLDDGEGWDGYCGDCADVISAHESGDHDQTPMDDCPQCCPSSTGTKRPSEWSSRRRHPRWNHD